MGLVSSNKVPDKFERTGLHAVKSSRVDAPVILEYPLTLECRVVEMQEQPYGLRVLGEIVNVMADEKILGEDGKIDVGKIDTFLFDQVRFDYYGIGEICGKAWHTGAPLLKK
jgi:flavin reductase (DIM6/NTAB) family NADH-FMN oxidoreductase RutF